MARSPPTESFQAVPTKHLPPEQTDAQEPRPSPRAKPRKSGNTRPPAVASRPLTAHEFFRHWMFDGQGATQSVHRCLYSGLSTWPGHSDHFVLTAAGHLYAWTSTQMWPRDKERHSTPTRVPLDNVTAITTGGAHSMALTRDGHLYTCFEEVKSSGA